MPVRTSGYALFPSLILREAIKAVCDAGGLVVAAAGNDALDISVAPLWPASFVEDPDLPCVMAIAALDRDGRLADFSNWCARNTAGFV